MKFANFILVSTVMLLAVDRVSFAATYVGSGQASDPSTPFEFVSYPVDPATGMQVEQRCRVAQNSAEWRNIVVDINSSPPTVTADFFRTVVFEYITGPLSCSVSGSGTSSTLGFVFPTVSVTSSGVSGSNSTGSISFDWSFGNDGATLSGSIAHTSLPGSAQLSRSDQTVCSVDVATLKQSALPWGPEPYDNIPPETIASKGCAITSLAMAINATPDVPKTDPLAFNGIAKYTPKGDVIWQSSLKEHHPGLKFGMGKGWIDSRKDLKGATDFIREALCEKQRPIILRVPGHFVVATAIQGDEVTIADPGYAKTSLSEWAWFETRGYTYIGNSHVFDVALSPQGTLLLTAPDGLRTGLDPTRNEVVQDIPNSAYFVDSIDSIGTPQDPTGSVQVPVREPAEGRYVINVIPEIDGFFDLQILVYANDGTPAGEFSIRDIGTSGVSKEIIASIITQPGGQSEVERIVTFDSLREDILTSSRLGLLTNEGIQTSLLSRVEASRVAMARGNVRAAVGPLSELKRFVENQAGIHIDAEVAGILADSTDLLVLSLK